MRSAVIVFPGSNCDRDLAVGLEKVTGQKPVMVWHKDANLPDNLDFVGVPGGFSFGDYLRCGAIAARAPIMNSVVRFAERGGMVFGVCNGFQILLESGLLPGSLMRNSGLKYVCEVTELSVETTDSPFTSTYDQGQIINIPIAHHDGNYVANNDLLDKLRDQDRIAFRYRNNPNGSVDDIAGILSENRRVLGMMPHPERMNDPDLGGTDGLGVFQSALSAMVSA